MIFRVEREKSVGKKMIYVEYQVENKARTKFGTYVPQYL